MSSKVSIINVPLDYVVDEFIYRNYIKKVEVYEDPKILSDIVRPFILLGAPGIGKTYKIKELAKKIALAQGRTLVDVSELLGGLYTTNIHEMGKIDSGVREKIFEILENPDKYFLYLNLRLTQLQPTDLLGFPKTTEISRDGKKIEFSVYVPLLWSILFNRVPGILHLDEITNVQDPAMQSAVLQVLGEKKSGMVKFNPKVLIIATGNKEEHSILSQMLPAPTINRCAVFEVEPSRMVDSWGNYMIKKYGSKWEASVLGFLANYKGTILKYLEEKVSAETYSNFPSLRSLEMMAVDLHINDVIKERDWNKVAVIAQAYIGDFSTTFVTFVKNIKDVEEVFTNPNKVNTLSEDKLYLLSSLLINRIVEFSEKLSVGAKITDKDLKEITTVKEILERMDRDEFKSFMVNALPTDTMLVALSALETDNKKVKKFFDTFVAIVTGLLESTPKTEDTRKIIEAYNKKREIILGD